MFGTIGDVVRGLRAYRDHHAARSSSVMLMTRTTTDVDADPFRRGYLDGLDARTVLAERLSGLDERERTILLLWYVGDRPVREICERTGVSRSQCYRLRDRALTAMLDPIDQIQEAYA